MIMTTSQDEQGLFISIDKWELRPTAPSGFKVHEQISVRYTTGDTSAVLIEDAPGENPYQEKWKATLIPMHDIVKHPRFEVDEYKFFDHVVLTGLVLSIATMIWMLTKL